MFKINGILLAVFGTCLLFGNTDAQGGTVYKTVIKEGTGPIPRPNQTVVVHYTGTLESGVKIDSSYDRNEPFKFRLGAGEVIAGWDAGVSSMKVGERAKLEIAPQDGYGPEGMPGVIPPNATLVFDIELLAVEDTPGVQTAPFSDIRAASGGFQSFGSVGQPQMQPTASLTFPAPQGMSFSQGMGRPAQPNREPNIQNLIARNNGFISEPPAFTGQFATGARPQGPQSIFGDVSFATAGQGMGRPAATRSGMTVPGLQNGFRSNAPGQVSFQQPQQQPQQQRPGQTPTAPFFNQVSGPQGRPTQSFGTPGGQATQFGLQGRAQGRGIAPFVPQPGMTGAGNQQFGAGMSTSGAQVGFGGAGGQAAAMDPRRFGMGAGFRTGGGPPTTAGRGPPGGTPDRATLMAMQERMLAARRMGLMPDPAAARGVAGPMAGRGPASMAEMLARARMAGGPGGIPPQMRALMAMRGGMGPRPGPMPPGFPRPGMSPFMARRMFRRRRLA